jgi:hypothetical protein
MNKHWVAMGLMAAPLLFAGKAHAVEKEKEPSAELEIGAAGEWGLPSGFSSFGPSVAIEYTPIKDWLEIEAGVSPLFGKGQTEWGTELVFKKTFSLYENAAPRKLRGPILLLWRYAFAVFG